MIVPGVPCLAYHPQHAWVPGVVEDFDGKVGIVSVKQPRSEKVPKLKESDIFVCDEKAMEEDVDDLLNLTVLHDGTLLNCLRHRYMKDIVYTNIGAIVVALNPFNFKIPWYMDEKMPAYLAEGDTIQNNLPHSWAVAHNTYYEMRNDMGNQCILVSGESGAGKTEASKIVMKYLGAVSSLRGKEEEKLAGQQVGVKMMQSNPILEAFGNAKTVRNDNSSRFGKLMKIKFNGKGILTGADITKYLLEKSRIITASPDERVYHSFYLVLKGKDRSSYGLNEIGFYKSVNSGGCCNVPGVDDNEDYDIVMKAMTTCGVQDEDRTSIWRTLSAILALQNLNFQEVSADEAKFDASTEEMLTFAAKSLEIDEAALRHEMLTTTLKTRDGDVIKTLNVVKSIDARDSLCKATYDNVFSWLVTTINKTIDTDDSETWVALLDIFGFEDFKINSFEQLCINLTNETLQNHYNNYIFIRDMEECRAEGIDTTEIKFPDNAPCLDMIAGKGGILSVLDEECLLGKATDLTFLDKICDKFVVKEEKGKKRDANASAYSEDGSAPTVFFERPKLAKVPSFKVNHYAGSVTYDVANFLEKNRDTLKDAFKRMMRASTNSFVAVLLPEPAEGVRYTVGGFFKTQLRDLMELINSTNPHWIRCIKPHPAKKPLHFDGPSTLTQLRSSGVLGTVQIRKAGYPIRIKLEDFCRRYKVIARGLDGVDFKDFASVAQGVYKVAGFPPKLAQVGRTRAFLKSEAYQQLEMLKKSKLQVFATTAVSGALLGLARRRTACFQKHHWICQVQAALTTRISQREFRAREYESKKDIIIAQVKAMLQQQKEEEVKRKEVEAIEQSMRDEIRVLWGESLSALEAKWWAQKPERDAVQLENLEREEEEIRATFDGEFAEWFEDMMDQMKDDEIDAQEMQAEREEEERQNELLRIKEEEERLRQEEEERIEAERQAAARRKEEQRRVAMYYWNKKKKEGQEAERRKEMERASKEVWVHKARDAAAISKQLMQHEKRLMAREHQDYPAQRFSVTSKHTNLMPIKIGLESSPRRNRDHDEDSDDAHSNDGSTINDVTRPMGIGGLNPMLINPAKEKERLNTARLNPDRAGSLAMVTKLRKLQTIKDPIVLRTPVLKDDDLRNPMNPTSPDWHPPDEDTVVLPDGTQLKMSEVDIPPEEKPGGRRGRRGRRGTMSH